MKKGIFIVLEGAEGSGKTTQVQVLQEHFGDKIITSREPGGTEYAEDIRNLALKHPLAGNADGKTLFLLMWGSRAEHMNNKVIPALEQGKIVVTDRFDSSTYALNIFGQEQESLRGYFWQTREAILGEYTPDMYVHLDLSPEVGLQRREGDVKEQDHFDKRDLEFHQRVQEGYSELYEKVPHTRVDADRSIEEVTKDLISVIEDLMDKRD